MRRRGKIIIGAALAATLGVIALFAATLWFLWRESITSEEAYSGGLATALGQSAEQTILDTRDMLAAFDKLQAQPCSKEHLQAMKDASVSRPYIRGIGYWRADERICDVGFLPQEGFKPSRADRIYDNGLIAWWPSRQTEVGGVQLFLMRYGNYDAAIDPRMLLDLAPKHDHLAVLWVENMRMSATPWDADLPKPDSLPVGITIDRTHERILSRFSRNRILPIDVVAEEPLENFWERHAQAILTSAGLGLLLVVAWIHLVLRLSRHGLSLASELREALGAGRIKVHYQPVMDLASGRCVGAEALARWKRDDGKNLGPNIFIPAAEEAGLIQEITVAVLKTAVRDMKAIVSEFPAITVNLNLAPDDLKNDRIGRELTLALATHGIETHTIKLEITERALVNSNVSRSLIREFRNRGHKVAVDDFGTGYSSLSYLQSFELDVLKIDRSFVEAIGTEAATSQVIVHIIEMAKSLGLDIVAEGVETTAQAAWLIAHGVAYAQGFLFSKPLSVGDFLEFLRSCEPHAAP